MASGQVFARGRQEQDPVHVARDLMAARNWDQAILVVREMMVSNSSRFDEGQGLIQEIMFNKRIYNEYFQRLIDAFLAGDLDLAYSIISEMERQDASPNPYTRALIVEARATAGVVATRTRFDNIMRLARDAIDDQRYSDAVEIYLSGSDLARDLFGDLELGAEVEARVDTANARVQELSGQFLSNLGQTRQTVLSVRDLTHPVMTNPDSVRSFEQNIASINSHMNDLLNIYRQILETSLDFLVYHDTLQSQLDLDRDIFHLVYLAYFYSGRPTAIELEGISGVIDLFSFQILEPMERFTQAIVDGMLNNLQFDFQRNQYANAGITLQGLDKAADIYIDSVEAWSSRLFINPRDGSIWNEDRINYAGLQQNMAFVQTVKHLVGLYENTALYAAEFQELENRTNLLNSENDYQTARMTMAALLSAIGQLVPDPDIPEISPEYDASLSLAAIEQFLENRDSIRERMLALDIRLEDARLARTQQQYQSELTAVADRIDSARILVDGRWDPDEETGVLVRDPQGGRDLFIAQSRDLAELDERIETVFNRVLADTTEINEDMSIQRHLSVFQEQRNSISDLSVRIDEFINRADEYLFLAQRFRQEGQDYFEEARSLLSRNEYDRARQRVEDAATAFDQSLSYQQDGELQSRRDNDLPALYDEIVDSQRLFIVQEVRTLITTGRNAYSRGDFAEAESTLLRAQARYSEVSLDPDQEIEYWLNLSQTALSVNTGREILPVDPLFPEMTQLLNLARSDFNEARDAIRRGDRASADRLLDRAESRILTVQQPFPMNQEASQMALRILQLRDPEGFNTIFSQRFNNARSRINTSPEEAYIELMDLRAIQADYPGMNQAIFNAEVATGIRVLPPQPRDLGRSRELYSQAFNIVSSNIVSQFPIALNALNEAIRIDPDFDDAIRLKDRIQVVAGGGTSPTVIFSPRDQRQFEEAASAFQSGRLREALSIVDRLLENPDNRRNTRLLELKDRISARL